MAIVTDVQMATRQRWVNEIIKLSGSFGDDADRVEQEIDEEIKREGIEPLWGHLRLCGAIPEAYRHDSSEEKLYSKYTDVVISKGFEAMGITSLVLKERADAADVQCVAKDFTFVADAKAFRLSRTAKNQKDFKVQAMEGWKRESRYAVVVCPIYQLPNRASQIYQQAASRSVCLLSYTHLVVLVRYAFTKSRAKATDVLHEVFKTVDALHPSKDASSYWQPINRLIIDTDASLRGIWQDEKKASLESIALAKEEGLVYLARERERIMMLSREAAIREVIRASKIDNKMRAIQAVGDNGLLDMAGRT